MCLSRFFPSLFVNSPLPSNRQDRAIFPYRRCMATLAVRPSQTWVPLFTAIVQPDDQAWGYAECRGWSFRGLRELRRQLGVLFSDERSPRQICAILCFERNSENRPPHNREETRYGLLTGRSRVSKKSFGDSDQKSGLFFAGGNKRLYTPDFSTGSLQGVCAHGVRSG